MLMMQTGSTVVDRSLGHGDLSGVRTGQSGQIKGQNVRHTVVSNLQASHGLK